MFCIKIVKRYTGNTLEWMSIVGGEMRVRNYFKRGHEQYQAPLDRYGGL